jgi:hypothetical protein
VETNLFPIQYEQTWASVCPALANFPPSAAQLRILNHAGAMIYSKEARRPPPQSSTRIPNQARRMSDHEPDANRRTPRQRALKGARIICAGDKTYDVTIRDISEGGVRLKLGSPFVVPESFVLVILNPNTGKSEKRTCETRWQRGDQVGAQFVAPGPEKPSAPITPVNLRRTAGPG